MLRARFSITNGESDRVCRSKSVFEAFTRFIDDDESMMAMVAGDAEFDRQVCSSVCRTGTDNQFLTVILVEISERSYPGAKHRNHKKLDLMPQLLTKAIKVAESLPGLRTKNCNSAKVKSCE